MTLRELQELLASEPAENANLEVNIWLPGSRISLHSKGTLIRSGRVLMIEGNIEHGWALGGTEDG